MTQQELNASLDRQLNRMHLAARRVFKARRHMQSASSILNERENKSTANSVSALGIAAMVLMLLVIDAIVAAPALVDRFASLGISVGAAWCVSIGASVLLMFLEMVVAVAWFRAYERSLTSRRYFAVAGWTLSATVVMMGPTLLSISQLLVTTGGDWYDLPRMTKEVGLILLLTGAHLALIASGRYLEAAKQQAIHWVRRELAIVKQHSAEQDGENAHNQLSDEYRIHHRSVLRARRDGLIAEMGPIEDQVIDLIRERNANVDDMIRQYSSAAAARLSVRANA